MTARTISVLLLVTALACGERPLQPQPAPSGLSWTVPAAEYRRYDEMDRAGTLAIESPELEPILGLRPGGAVADVGTGAGFYLWWFAEQVGPTGRVYAVDVDPNSVAFLRRRLERRPLPNLEVVQSRLDDCGLPEDSVDVVFMNQVHAFTSIPATAEALADPERRPRELSRFREQAARFVASLRRALRPGGRMVIVEMRKDANPVADLDRPEVREMLLSFGGFRLEREEPAWGDKSWLLVFSRQPRVRVNGSHGGLRASDPGPGSPL